jgi:hypothetical protein
MAARIGGSDKIRVPVAEQILPGCRGLALLVGVKGAIPKAGMILSQQAEGMVVDKSGRRRDADPCKTVEGHQGENQLPHQNVLPAEWPICIDSAMPAKPLQPASVNSYSRAAGLEISLDGAHIRSMKKTSLQILTATLSIASGAVNAQILKNEPGDGTLPRGKRVLVDDGSCPTGQIKQVTGGSKVDHIARSSICLPDRRKK